MFKQSSTNKSSFTPSNLSKKTVDNYEKLDRIFAKISKKDKEDLFVKQLKIDYYNKSVDQEIKISNIFSPPAFSRNQHDDEYDDLEIANDLEPIKVVEAPDIKGYFIVDGQRRLEYQKQQGSNQIRVLIIGKATCRSQIAAARAKEMTNLKRPLNTLELVLGLVQLCEVIIADFGEDAFFGHGGNGRKEGSKDKQSLSKFIAQATGLKPSSVNVLLNFGRQLGPYGLAGIENHKDMRNLSIRVINQINSKLKKDNLSKELSEIFHKFGGAQSTEAEQIKACGNIAHQIISGHIAALTEGHNNDDESEEFESFELNPSNYDLPLERDKKPQDTKADGKNPDNDSDDNETENDDAESDDSNLEDEIKETLKILKRFKHLVPRFEKELRSVNQVEETIQNNLYKKLIKFNENSENMISLIKKIITDLKLEN